MNGGDFLDEVPRNRCVLGDVTNSYGKRAFPLAKGRFVSGNDAYRENAEARVGYSKLQRSACGGVERSVSKKGKTSCMRETYKGTADVKGKGPAPPKAERPSQYVIPDVGCATTGENSRPDAPYFAEEAKDPAALHPLSSGAAGDQIREADSSKHSCNSYGSLLDRCNESELTSPESEEESQEDSEMDSAEFARHDFKTGKRHEMSSSALSDSCKDFAVSKENRVHGGDISTRELFDRPCSLGCSRPPGSFDSEMDGTEGLLNLHAASMAANNTVEGNINSGKACSCSFCLKAAYMWTDLHYQDTRGRLAALKKSRRHAKSFEGKLCNHDQTNNIARDNSKKSIELEFDLMQRCRSLFLHTEDALVRETTQLHSDLLRLKELRERCKKDLERGLIR